MDLYWATLKNGKKNYFGIVAKNSVSVLVVITASQFLEMTSIVLKLVRWINVTGL